MGKGRCELEGSPNNAPWRSSGQLRKFRPLTFKSKQPVAAFHCAKLVEFVNQREGKV